MTEPLFTWKGDSAGGFWAQIRRGGSIVAVVYEPGMAARIVALLNADEAAVAAVTEEHTDD